MSQERSLALITTVVCLQAWLLSPLSQSAVAAAPSQAGSYEVEMARTGLPMQVEVNQAYGQDQNYEGIPVQESASSCDEGKLGRRAMDKRRLRFRHDDEGRGYFYEPRQTRRLRFHKRAAEQSAGSSSSSGSTQGQSHSRKRRSALLPLSGLGEGIDSIQKRISVSNDLQAISDMVHHRIWQQRQNQIRQLRERLIKAGKRSVSSIIPDDNDDVLGSGLGVLHDEDKNRALELFVQRLLEV